MMKSSEQPARVAARADAATVGEILRFRASERRLHWAIAVPYLLCFVTALVLFAVYNLHPERPLRLFFWWAHRLAAVGLIVLPPWTMLRHRHDIDVYRSNMRHAWAWRLDDVKWLLLMGPATLSTRVVLPHQGKFNAAEKINFMTLTVTYPLFIVTGLFIWFGRGSYASWLAHLAMALSATPLVFGHLFMAVVNPDTRVGLSGMFSGFVDRAWARHHYRRWYDEHFAHAEVATAADQKVEVCKGEFAA